MEDKSKNKKEQEFNSNYNSAYPTCGCSELSQMSSSNMIEEGHMPKLRNPNKLNVDIYVPLKICSCQWSSYINSVFNELTPYMKVIDHQTKDMQTKEANILGVRRKCIVIDNKTKISTAPVLKKQLPRLLKERGLI